MKFHVTDAKKPLASAASIVKAGNRVILEGDGGYIENVVTKQRIPLKIEGGTFVFEVESANVSPVFSRQA